MYLVNDHKVIQCSIRDITKRKEAEAELEKTRKELAEIKRIADEESKFTENKLSENRFLGFTKDITERKIAEQALKASEDRYKTILNASPDGILIINLKGIITEVSEIGLELLGADNRGELIGKHFLRFIPSEEKNTIQGAIEMKGLLKMWRLKSGKKINPYF